MFKKLTLALVTAAACTSAFALPVTTTTSTIISTDPYMDPVYDVMAEDACSRDGNYCSPPKPPK